MARHYLLTAYFLTAFLPAAALQAAESLNFNTSLTPRAKTLIMDFLGSGDNGPDIAKADLNEDGLDEYIVKADPACAPKAQPCLYRILAESKGKIVPLGDISANSIALGDTYSHGIRNLIAFANPKNDFEYAVYVWEPESARYMMKKRAMQE